MALPLDVVTHPRQYTVEGRLGLLLGLRPGEVLGLPWTNVDLDEGVLHVRQSLKRERDGLHIGDVKTPRSRRSLAIPKPLADALRSHRVRQAEQRLAAADWVDTGLVVTTRCGSPVDPSNYRRAFSAICKKAGLGHWHPNELRHSFVSLLHATGVPIDKIADLVGHDSFRMTAGVYRHLVDPVVRHAVELVDHLFGEDVG